MPRHMRETDNVLWVRTEPVPSGGTAYMVTVSTGPDSTDALDPEEAVRYATAMMRAAAYANYDAAIAKQLNSKLKLGMGNVAAVLEAVRAGRPELTEAGFTWKTGVNRALKPFVEVHHPDSAGWQMDVEAVRSHAAGVLEAVAIADLDQMYLETLTDPTVIGLDEDRGRQVVTDIGEYLL